MTDRKSTPNGPPISETAIIVVDDDRCTCDYLNKVLTESGYRVDVANNGPAAIRLAEDHAYALAVLDFRMPDMDGDEVYRRLRERQPQMAAVFLTGYPTLDTVYPAIKSGAARVMAKPVDPDELVRTIKDSLIAQAASA